ncbi:MAG: transposase [Hyphomicrobiales bacterium]|nr:transposase [Hyphomicrobiales bacterium]
MRGKEPLRLITNDLKRSAAAIATLYKLRWQNELFFKWIKQNFKVKAFLGRSQNAIKIQLYVALIAFLLLTLAKQTCARTHKGSIKDLLARLRLTLLNPIDLSARARSSPKSPRLRPPKPQLEFELTGSTPT